MPQEAVLVTCAGPAPINSNPLTSLDKTGVTLLLKFSKKAVRGTFSALDKDWRVDREGDVLPVSILDNIPADKEA